MHFQLELMLIKKINMDKTIAIQHFFREIEKKYGNLKTLIKPFEVVVSKSIETSDLDALFSHRIGAIHVPEFYPKDACRSIVERLKHSGNLQNWQTSSARGLESSDVQTIGVPFNMAVAGGPAAVDAYFEGSAAAMRALREGLLLPAPPPPPPVKRVMVAAAAAAAATAGAAAAAEAAAAAPLLAPLDRLRLELDERWPRGARLARERGGKGRAHLSGLGRVMQGPTRSLEGFCHVDDLAPLDPGAGTFSANVYLETPPAGGHLHLWGLELRSRWDFHRNAFTLSALMTQDPGGQARLRAALGPPAAEVRPAPGDLVLLCVQRPHAVQGFPFGTRISFQAFINHNKEKALTIEA